MPPTEQPAPTEAELEILRILWRREKCTVREVHDELRRRRKVSYTGALKLLQLMHEKRLVVRNAAARAHVYYPAITEESLLDRLTQTLLEKAFGGAVDKLVLHALSGKAATREELENIRRLLDEMEESGQ